MAVNPSACIEPRMLINTLVHWFRSEMDIISPSEGGVRSSNLRGTVFSLPSQIYSRFKKFGSNAKL